MNNKIHTVRWIPSTQVIPRESFLGKILDSFLPVVKDIQGGGIFIAIPENGQPILSEDGVTWTSPTQQPAYTPCKVCGGGAYFGDMRYCEVCQPRPQESISSSAMVLPAGITEGEWKAESWSCHKKTTILVDDPSTFLGKRVVAECETEEDAQFILFLRKMAVDAGLV